MIHRRAACVTMPHPTGPLPPDCGLNSLTINRQGVINLTPMGILPVEGERPPLQANPDRPHSTGKMPVLPQTVAKAREVPQKIQETVAATVRKAVVREGQRGWARRTMALMMP